MKKVLVLEDSRKVGFGGGQKGSLELLEALHEHFELIATDSKVDSIFAARSESILGRPIHRLRSYAISGGDKASFNVGWRESLLFPFFTLWNLASLLLLLRRHRMSSGNAILYAPSKKTLVLAWSLSRITGIPYVYHARSFDDRESRFFTLLVIMLKRARAILCVSRTIAKNLDMPQCELVYNAIPVQDNVSPKSIPSSNSDPVGCEKFVVAAFASLLAWKGLQYLVQAAGLVQQPELVEVRIYGEGPLRDELEKQCPNNCLLMGFAENVNELLGAEVHAVCAPSIAEEAFGRVPMEANSFGIPAIVTNIGAQAEITLDAVTGYHVPIRDARAIADAIDDMLCRPHHYRALCEQALRHSRSFDLRAQRTRLLEIFQSI